MALYNSNFVSS